MDNRSADPDYNATFPRTPANSVAIGQCIPGRNGFPQRFCNAGGDWEDEVIANPCSSTG